MTPSEQSYPINTNSNRAHPRPFLKQPSDSTIRFIPLTQGQYAIVDASDYEWLSQWNWHALWHKRVKKFYAVRNSSLVNGKSTLIAMHREILGLKFGDPRKADHREPSQTLDNRRSNLRIASNSENGSNCTKRAHNTSGYKGVSWDKWNKKFSAQITVEGKKIKLGLRLTAEAAWRELYVPAAEKYQGEFARTT